MKDSRAVIGLDPGTFTGWAVCVDGKIADFGTLSLKPWEEKGFGAMFREFRRWLGLLRGQYIYDFDQVIAIAYELPFHRGAITSRITGGMAAHVMERAAAWRCKALPVNTMTLKKFATGSGSAEKRQMIEAACDITGMALPREWTKATISELEHQADAIHIARWAWEKLA